MAKKSYNAFKMWGSWGGAIVGLLIIVLSISNEGLQFNTLLSKIILFPAYIVYLATSFDLVGLFIFLPFILEFIYGFLIGWGIHSLIRRIRK